MDLFNDNKRVYVIDTSALIRLDLTFKKEIPVFTAIWDEIEDLILQGCFKTIDFVENEINDYEGKEEADPYLIGYCQVHNCVLITDENKTKPNKIPAVAKKNGIDCIDVNDFLVERELKIQRKI